MAMTASMTRSRRAEGLRHAHSPIAVAASAPPAARQPIVANSFSTNINRNKRQYDSSTCETDPVVTKKPRYTIAVEIPAPVRDSRDAKQPKPAAPAVPEVPVSVPAPPKPAPTTTSTNPSNPPRTAPTTASNCAPKPNNQHHGVTKHQEKVANGLKHELNRLKPASAPDLNEKGRKLRSQEATRFKSELSTYFPEYDEVIGNDPKPEQLLNADAPILIVPGSPASTDQNPSLSLDGQDPQQPHSAKPYSIRGYGDALFTDLFDSQRIDFKFLESQSHKGKSLKDPLPDSVFEPWHEKAERRERSARNTERARAQHEKDQIIRLLDGLQGHDWLRIMGVSGITESKKKAFEPARRHFIKGCLAILEKFRLWAAEEKRRKLEKERAAAEAEAQREAAEAEQADDEDEEEDDEVEDEEEEEEGEEEIRDSDGDDEEVADSQEVAGDDEEADVSDGDPPDYDVDASIAKQLREEVIAAAKKKTMRRGTRAKSSPRPMMPRVEPEFRSFFRKEHERAAAMNRARRRGRMVKAWGQPVPDVHETEFELPEEFRDKDTLDALDRSRRLRKRRKN